MTTAADLRNAYRALLNTDDGVLVLEDLRRRFHCEQPTFSTDALEMAYLEGQRSVVLIIQNMMKDFDHNLTESLTDE